MGEINRLLGDAGAGFHFDAAGQRWILSPLTKGRQAEFEAWLESRALAKAERSANKAHLERVEDRIAGGHYSFGGRASQVALQTPDGALEMLRILLAPEHPDITTETVLELLEGSDAEKVSHAVQRVVEDFARSRGKQLDPPAAPAE